jgi:glycosyltransferase involved in cell wall biosynthesis
MTIVLYRRRLSLTSGAGQLIRMQAEGLRAAGCDVRAACSRGAFRFGLKTRLPVRRMSLPALRACAGSPEHLVVDHQMAVPEADLVFVHNLVAEAVRFVEHKDWARAALDEARFFAALKPAAPIVANSDLVKRALIEHFNLDSARITVLYPGIDADRFAPHGLRSFGLASDATVTQPAQAGLAHENTPVRLDVRKSLGVAENAPLIGLITSGEFDKRGLDIFLATAGRIAAARPDARFLVVGARRLPEAASRHPLVTTRRVIYRPKSSRPERWFAALDIFLYPAVFEEFGMVVSEAQASGLPVLTSRRVGAAECLPQAYAPWLVDAPDAAAFADKTLALIADEPARLRLAAAGVQGIRPFGGDAYVRRTLAIIRECARAKLKAHWKR